MLKTEEKLSLYSPALSMQNSFKLFYIGDLLTILQG
jgi:hypothetical protein